MRPESAKYLRDMLDAARAIEQYTRGLSGDDYLSQRSIRDAVHWNFCVIGEAMSQLVHIDKQTATQITEHSRIIAFRNQLIHGYGVVDARITWSIITDKLPVLLRELEQMSGVR